VKRLLLLAGLVGFAVYLLTPSRTPPMGPAETVSTAQAPRDRQTSGPLGSSWGSSLQFLTQDPDAALAESQQPAPSETAASGPKPHTDKQEWQPKRGPQPSGSVDHASAPSPNDTEREAVEWVKIDQVVAVRSKPSVSSLGLRSYSTGSRAQVVGRENGWVQLLDPMTQERGWVYHTYLSPIDGPGAARPEATSGKPQVRVASPPRTSTSAPKPAVRTLDPAKITKAKTPRDGTAQRAKRRRGLGLFKRRRARREPSMSLAR
jgi:hypothetical protein